MRLLAGRALRLSVALAGMLTAAGAFAHAHLQQQIPTAGAQLSASPQTLTLSFSEGIEPAFSGVTVTGPPSAIWRLNTGMTLPFEPSTFPKRTAVNTVSEVRA